MMQNSILHLDKALLFPRNQVICLRLVNFDELPLQYFLLKLCTRFDLANVYKKLFRNSLTLFRSWVIDKPGFGECVETRSFFILPNKSSSKQNEENLEHPFVSIGK